MVEADALVAVQGYNCLQVFDPDGPGPLHSLLVVGGRGSTNPSNSHVVVKFDGTTWSTMGSAIGSNSGSEVRDLEVFNGELYACGRFTNIFGLNNIAKWDQSTQDWVSVSGGIPQAGSNIRAESMAVCDLEGTGMPALYIGGTFDFIGDDFIVSKRLAKWDVTSWSAVPGFTNVANAVSSSAGAPAILKSINFGDGESLLVGDAIYSGLTGTPLTRGVALARRKGGAWSTLIPQTTSGSTGSKAYVYSAALFAGPDGSQLHVGGRLVLDGVAGQPKGAGLVRRSVSGVFSPLGTPFAANGGGGFVCWMLPLDWDFSGPGGTKLLFGNNSRGGLLGTYDGFTPQNIALWNGTAVEPAHTGSAPLGIPSTSNGVVIRELDADGAGPWAPALYVGTTNSFYSAGRLAGTGVLVFNGTGFQATPGGPQNVSALETFTPAGGSTALYASSSDGTVSKFDGVSWQTIGAADLGDGSVITSIDSLVDTRFAGLPALLAAGRFDQVSGAVSNFVVRYDGTT